MVYARRYGRYGTVRRRAPYRRRAAYRPVRRVARRRMSMYRAPAALVGGRGATEMKSVDYGPISAFLGTFNAAPASPYVANVSGIPLNGAAFYNRIGTRTRAVSLELRGCIEPSNVNETVVNAGFARVAIVYDRQPNGSFPKYDDIFTDYDSAGSTASGAFSGVNMNNRDRFLVLRDRKLLLPALAATTGGGTPFSAVRDQGFKPTPGDDNNSLVFREFIKLKGLESHFKASTGAIGDIATGSFLIALCHETDWQNLATPRHAAWVLNFETRFKFFD